MRILKSNCGATLTSYILSLISKKPQPAPQGKQAAVGFILKFNHKVYSLGQKPAHCGFAFEFQYYCSLAVAVRIVILFRLGIRIAVVLLVLAVL